MILVFLVQTFNDSLLLLHSLTITVMCVNIILILTPRPVMSKLKRFIVRRTKQAGTFAGSRHYHCTIKGMLTIIVKDRKCEETVTVSVFQIFECSADLTRVTPV